MMYVKDEDFYWLGVQNPRRPEHYSYFPAYGRMWGPDYIAFYGGEHKFISRKVTR